ncbi:hypothetical protein DXO206_023075 (plasmid) [Xanthomonas oryzae pv. oryzae]|uniref:hypothetical protein n=1 Tax=Xanthomonas TaxID=338 RepID=UPI00052B84AD|nr:hypothetical protein EBA18_24895 [Xanthomonas oryzae pv. oryzae]WDN17635.1 hypothetical protein LL920_23670 [Xanthomonas oryzae]CEH39098.1 conserved membrane hypothetical protein [Xanthomonas citri pv. citri]QEJ71038.1 hypothetical protein BXO1_025050 [Xanthomonas oryzae pv. oryzae]RBB63098.1 hypothetical protein BRN54_21715 [Xanthomonas oryzae pv. oryzae]
MLDVEASFEKLLGRQPSEKEIQSLYRVKNALNIRDNDALWLVLMALESYDTLYRKYPAMISDQVGKILDEQRSTMAAIADAATKKSLGTLADAVSKTSERVAVRLVDASRWLSWGWAWFAFAVFGTLCVFVGFVLGSGRLPYWAVPTPDDGLLVTIMGALARTPAGWLAAAGGAAAVIGAAWRARDDLKAGRRLGLLAACVGLLAASAAFLLPVVAVWKVL